MTSKKFGGRMYYNVCTMLYGTDQIRCAKGIVYNQRQTVFMSKGSQSVYIRDITVGISEGFNINGSCILPDCRLYFCKIMDIYKGCSNSEVRKRMGKQVIASTINGFLCDKMASVLPQSLKSIGNCRCAGSKGKGSYTAFQSRDPLFQNILRRICQTSVNISCIGKTKPRRRMSRIFKNIRSGGIIW